MKRRAFMGSLAAWPVFAATPEKSEAAAIRSIAEGFLREHGIQGMSIAFGRDGKIEFEQGYGFADAAGKEVVTPEHRFRIASISKPITATAVLMSVEKGQLKLDDKVFGSQGILGDVYGRDLPKSVLAITIDHLLTHLSGGWANDKNDPMFKDPAMTHYELITWTLANQKQTHQPGMHYAYSNFGYCVLGRVLEKIHQTPYETLITRQVLSRCGITSMKIAGNTLAQRQPNEVMYLTEKPDAAYGMNVTRMDSHGGWIATAGDLVRFASQLPKLLNEESIRTMTTAGVGGSYARGWSVNKVPNWWHGGSLPGTSTIMVHTAREMCWAGLLNGRKEGLGLALDKLMWQMGRVAKAGG
ncbi:MAG: serine hydrolase domain-containing protein, partial [Prosthecobacter sp.]|nr:serine hydrolase domain-containing protein [Prosthecobacter sp.]